MNKSKAVKVFLVISGLVLVVIGAGLLFVPETFHASNGIDLGGQVNLLNETRAPGGALLGSGIVILAGVFVASLTFTSAVVSVLIYLSYGISRIYSMLVDGMPSDILVGVMVLEIVIGTVGLYALKKGSAIQQAV
jgi:hypothetical protein